MPLELRLPLPHDIFGNDMFAGEGVTIAGYALGSPGSFDVRVFDDSGGLLGEQMVHPAGSGEIGGAFCVRIGLAGTAAASTGRVEIRSGMGGTGAVLADVPIIFGSALVPGYYTFDYYTVVAGDSLWAIAERYYGDGTRWPAIHGANHHVIADPNLIFPGQLFRIPMDWATANRP